MPNPSTIRLFPLFLTVVCSLTVSNADTTIRYVSVDPAGEVTAVEKLHITDERMAMTAEGSKVTTVFEAKTGRLFTIDRENESITEVDPAAIVKKAEQHVETRAKVLEGIEARLAEVSKEEREKLKSVMDEIHEANRKAVEEPVPIQYVGHTEPAKVGDFDAQVVDAIRGNRKDATYFLVSSETLGMSALEVEVLNAFQFFLYQLSEKMPAGVASGLGDFDLLVSDEGEIPVKKIKYDRKSGDEASQEILNGVDHDPVPDDLFRVPADYKVENL